MINEDYNEEEYWENFEANAGIFSEALPRVVREFQKAAVEFSHYNDIPAGISFFNILGQVVKDFIQIGSGRNIEDSRIHFCWVQTSGTGKSTLWNFVGPVANGVFKKINAKGKHPSLVLEDRPTMPRTFDIFSLTDYTDSVLIGGFKKEFDDEGEIVWERMAGQLEGNGLAHWDEFEYSGIFKQSQHQEKSIVYMNTLMNSLAGESWIISKALTSFENQVMECFAERSVIAMTYPPSNLNDVMAEKGVLQRMLLFVWEVPKFIQHKMRKEQIRQAGTFQPVKQPVEKFSNAIFSIYELVEERFKEVGGDPIKVMKYSPDFNDVLLLEYENMNNYLWNTRPEVEAIASNFTTRLMKILMKMSVLCSVASAPSIKNKNDRFLVSGHNVRQAATIVRQSYMTLVDWLERSLRVRQRSQAEKADESIFKKAFEVLEKNEEGFVHKGRLFETVRKKSKKSQSQIYRNYALIQHKFEETKIGQSKYIKYIAGDVE
tara:strand:+ start:513 stop:1979 length:1467 start_codon:yes stop_codon:yes gene_type:complete